MLFVLSLCGPMERVSDPSHQRSKSPFRRVAFVPVAWVPIPEFWRIRLQKSAMALASGVMTRCNLQHRLMELAVAGQDARGFQWQRLSVGIGYPTAGFFDKKSASGEVPG